MCQLEYRITHVHITYDNLNILKKKYSVLRGCARTQYTHTILNRLDIKKSQFQEEVQNNDTHGEGEAAASLLLTWH